MLILPGLARGFSFEGKRPAVGDLRGALAERTLRGASVEIFTGEISGSLVMSFNAADSRETEVATGGEDGDSLLLYGSWFLEPHLFGALMILSPIPSALNLQCFEFIQSFYPPCDSRYD